MDSRPVRLPFILLCAMAIVTTWMTQGSAAEANRLSGTVWRFPYIPLAGATVQVHDAYGVSAVAVTNEQGRYTVVGGFYGPLTIDVSRDGYASEERACSAVPGDGLRADFSIESFYGSANSEGPNPYDEIDVFDAATHTSRRFPAMSQTCVLEPETTDRYVINRHFHQG